MKQIELERAEKRLESLNSAKPAHFSEMRQLEAELSHVYRIYVEKIRNHDFLSASLERYHKIEDEDKRNRDIGLEKIRQQIQKMDERVLLDENEELNADYDNNDDFYENYQQEAKSKNVNYNFIFLEL